MKTIERKTRRITVALPLDLYQRFTQFAFYRLWSDSKAGVFLIERALRRTAKRGK